MLVIDTKSTNPYFNLACEEYLFRKFTDEILFLYINAPSLIIGKHQNAYEEVNLEFVLKNKLPLIRRISGGGTVYHDEGNINFTFIRNREEGKQVSFIEHTRPVISFFEEQGLSPYVGDKNEIREDGLKFSGNAEHVFKNRVLHHGTILFSSELGSLKDALERGKGIYTSRSVQSNRTRVGNLSARLKNFKSAGELKDALEQYIAGDQDKYTAYNLTEDDRREINKLVEEKYSLDDWNYGYGPDYKFRNHIDYKGKDLILSLQVKKGIITACSIEGDSEWGKTASKLVGAKHLFKEVSNIIRSYHQDADDALLYSFFY